MKKVKLLLMITISVVLMNACKKADSEVQNNTDAQKATYTVRMTDAPGPYTAVNVDIRGVEITGQGGKNVLLNVKPGIYNLLDFSNGVDTMIASGAIDAGTVQQIRLILGPDNSVIVDSMTYPLSVPSGEQSGLKLQVHQQIAAGSSYIVLLDFDANRSVIRLGNGGYKLKPVIRTVEKAISGSIAGTIDPAGIIASVSAINGTDTFSSFVNLSGNYMIKGLLPGTYDVTINPASPYTAVTIKAVVVTAGVSTNIGQTKL